MGSDGSALARFSALGEHGAVWVAIGLGAAAVDAPRRTAWLRGARRVLAAYAVNQIVKVVVRRPRPQHHGVRTHSELSFPSAHATTSFCGARAYSAVEPRLTPALYGLAVALAASRIALRVHHPSDVLAGAVLGTVLAR